MISIPLTPEQEARLRERAAAVGKDVAEYLRQVVEEDLAASEPSSVVSAAPPDDPNAWLAEFRAWVASHPRLDRVADDSRQSIYRGRGE